MHETDWQQLEGMMAGLVDRDRVNVSARSLEFTLMYPEIRTAYRADFAIRGVRRHRSGLDAQYGFTVTKIIIAEKRRLVVQDEYGRILTLAHPTGAWMPDESERAER